MSPATVVLDDEREGALARSVPRRKANRTNVTRIREVHRAYLRLRSLKKAGNILDPPVSATRARNMLERGASLGLFDALFPPRGAPRPANVGRLHDALRLYRKFGTSAAAAAAMTPPISQVRLRGLLRTGAGMGLFEDPLRWPDGRDVAAAVRETGSVKDAARHLGVSVSWLRKHFAGATSLAAEVVRARRRAGHVAEYLALARRLGRNPGMSIPTLGNNLYQKIWREWGSAAAFFREAGVIPDLLGPTGKPQRRTAGGALTDKQIPNASGSALVGKVGGG